MPILGRYILKTVIGYSLLVLLVLLTLGALFLFINEQDDIGTGSYTASQAMIYVMLSLPTFGCQLLPVAALIGGLLGLGNLARGSELVVMRASGITTLRFCTWLAVAGIILAVFMVGISEFVAPPLERYGRQVKVFSKYNEFSFAGNQGTWVRDGNTIISVDEQTAATSYGGIEVFRIQSNQSLASVARADAAEVNRKNTWRLQNFRETRFTDSGTEVRQVPSEEIRSNLSPDFLGLAATDTQSMGYRDLLAYIDHLRRNNLDASRFEVAFWSRTARIVALLLVVILALPFALGPMRSSGQGARTVVGILIGAGFVLLSQTLENSGRLLGLSPILTGWLPTVLLGTLTFGMLSRTR